ncbi:MAG: GtrA family protein [Patescibacteria group bacterium]|nr:GtrA family protein [Patescibacteria group bacterium]
MNLKKIILSQLERYLMMRQLIKFAIVGGSAAAINFIIYYSLTKHFSFWYVYSSAAGFTISAIFNFTSNKFWTFRNKAAGKHALRQVAKFAIVMISGLVINMVIIYFLTDMVGIDWRWSWLLANGVVTFWSFGFNRFWTFRHIIATDSNGLSSE